MTSLTWTNKSDADAVRDFHRQLYERWKGGPHVSPVDRDPDFPQHLQRLHDYGYAITDIGVMWGVSVERVRQWFKQYGLIRYDEGASLRIWDDDLELFLPVSRGEYHRRRKDAQHANRVHAALMEDVRLVRRLAGGLGKPPLLSDLAEVVYGDRRMPVAGPAYRWGWANANSAGDCSYAEAMDRLYDAAGMPRPSHAEGQRRRIIGAE